MSIDAGVLEEFAAAVRRLVGQGEPPLYPAFRELLSSAYGDSYHVDSLLRTPGAGYPDFTVSRGVRIVNWVEIKAPGTSVDRLPTPDRERFERYQDALPHIVLTNGLVWRLFINGSEVNRVELPSDWLLGSSVLSTAHVTALQEFFRIITSLVPAVASTYEDAVRLLAMAARLVERAVLDALQDDLPAPLAQARESFTELLRTNPSDPAQLDDASFADALAQTCTFGYLIARVEAGHDIDINSAPDALSTTEHPFLKSSLHAVISPDPDLERVLKGVLRTACDAVNAAAPKLAGATGAWDRVPYVYEPFFELYRPEDRFKFGVFYTPEEITRYQVGDIRRSLVDNLGVSGLLDPRIRFLDPACGTGTYLLALAEAAREEALDRGLPAASALQELFRDRVVGFDVSPGPAVVAQARLTAWLKSNGVTLGQRFPVYVVNTLTPPHAALAGTIGAAYPSVWAHNISQEADAGDRIKRDTPVLVVFGNPPWGDRPRETFQYGPLPVDNWVSEWAQNAAGAVIHLYDLYVAFWRFGLSLLLERPEVQSATGVVSFITNRSWLRGKAYAGFRRWLRDRNVCAEIVDLGGDIRAGAGADDEPVFAILAGSAISTLTFSGQGPGSINFRRVRGTRGEKLRTLTSGELPDALHVEGERGDAFGLIDWGPLTSAPRIDEFFSSRFPGVKTHRDHLVVNVDNDALISFLRHWEQLSPTERQQVFGPTATHRMAPGSPYEFDQAAVMRHRYRPLDDRFIYGDRNFIDRPGTIWRYYEENQTISLLAMDSRTSFGPVLIATNTLPGYNSFRGSYETHCFPLSPPPGTLVPGDALSPAAREWASSFEATTEDVAAYLLALAHAPSYAATFIEAMESQRVRFPATEDSPLFWECVRIGNDILAAWLLDVSPSGRWLQRSAGLAIGSVRIDGAALAFESGDRLEGVDPTIFDFKVSSYPVLHRFLEARAHLALTLELAESIRLVVAAIELLVSSGPTCDELLRRVLAAPMRTF